MKDLGSGGVWNTIIKTPRKCRRSRRNNQQMNCAKIRNKIMRPLEILGGKGEFKSETN
jgi:hypothetical protein